MHSQRIASVGLAAEGPMLLTRAFDRAWPVSHTMSFSQLLEAIDHADRHGASHDRTRTSRER
jgi:hypothetical protein